MFFLLTIQLSCAPIPADNNSVIKLKNRLAFPYVFLDFNSFSLVISEIDGQKTAKFGWIELPAGKHNILLEVMKGPTGYLGTAPLKGVCYSAIEFEFKPNTSYLMEFHRENKEEFVFLIDKTTGRIVLKSECISKKIY
ncbi:MAG: hypothetical protein N2999_00555 [Proteobacteria bacterium]|nr:hypothetical protein [Pseudomonadota bacterium]